MSQIKVGDIVARKSYGYDILFRVTDINEGERNTTVVLHGLCYRLEADATLDDLVVQSENKIREHNSKFEQRIERSMRNSSTRNSSTRNSSTRNSFVSSRNSKKAQYRETSKANGEKFLIQPKILHLDGDNEYLNSCIEQYKKLDLNVKGIFVPEKEQSMKVRRLLEENQPSILVLTGHDAMIKGDKGYFNVDNYRNSKFFIQSVLEARKFEPVHEKLVIFAGACQSYFKGLIDAGADYASAPFRVNIHALDPVFVCHRVSNTYFYEVLSVNSAISSTITGYKGVGGIQTFGQMKEGYPKEPYDN